MIKAIFWDNDGVLVNTGRLYFLATQRVLATVGVTLTKEQYIEFSSSRGGAHGTSPRNEASLHPPSSSCGKNATRSTANHSEERLLIDGVREVLEGLHKRYVMGIFTSSDPDHFEIIHCTTGLLPYFQYALTSGDYKNGKPHPEPYLKALERSGCRREECIVVEDSEGGPIAATEAGLRCIVVPSELTRGRNFDRAYKVLQSLTELLPELSRTGDWSCPEAQIIAPKRS